MTTHNQQQRPRLGFIGMGGMGSRMAGRLLTAGYDLTIYNRARERTQLLEQRGARVAATPAELAVGVDIVLWSVADNTAVENKMTRSDGAAARPGTIGGPRDGTDRQGVAPATHRQPEEILID